MTPSHPLAAFLVVPALLAFSTPGSAEVRYVDAGLTSGANDGTSWADAFRGSGGLQAALGVAVAGDRVFVARGTYHASSSNTQVSFRLMIGVELYGGFLGTESSPDERPPIGAAPSTLDGDLPSSNSNSLHLVDASGVDASAVLDGFTLRGGFANSYPIDENGGGLYCDGGAGPTVRNCRFTQNRATFLGGAVFIGGSGGGSGPSFVDCEFDDNRATGNSGLGGAVCLIFAGAARFERCVFRGNRSRSGGGIGKTASSGSLVVSNSVFHENLATYPPGGGAMRLERGAHTLIANCTFVSNTAAQHPTGGVLAVGAPTTIVNGILWDNGGHATSNQIAGPVSVTWSTVDGGSAGTGNRASDPRFLDRANGDLRLSISSPAIDAGDNDGVQDGGELDLAHNPRRTQIPSAPDVGHGVARIVDMGAFEFPWPPVTAFCAGDGTATPCPCGNAGASGAGCANGAFQSGCELAASGVPSLSNDTLELTASSSPPGQPGVFFQGDAATNGAAGLVFGDGLRCAGQNTLRLELATADSLGNAATSLALSVEGGLGSGDVKHYQWWYRDPQGSPCGAGFNLSNGLEVQWVP